MGKGMVIDTHKSAMTAVGVFSVCSCTKIGVTLGQPTMAGVHTKQYHRTSRILAEMFPLFILSVCQRFVEYCFTKRCMVLVSRYCMHGKENAGVLLWSNQIHQGDKYWQPWLCVCGLKSCERTHVGELVVYTRVQGSVAGHCNDLDLCNKSN
jgi:hypothetical protein